MLVANGIILAGPFPTGHVRVMLTTDGSVPDIWCLANPEEVPQGVEDGWFEFEPEDQFCYYKGEPR